MDILDLFLCPKRVQISVLQFAVSIKAKFINFINLLIFLWRMIWIRFGPLICILSLKYAYEFMTKTKKITKMLLENFNYQLLLQQSYISV